MLCCKNRVFLWSSRCRLRQHLRHLHLCFLRSSFFCSLAISSAVRVGSCAGWKKPTINLNLQAYRMRSKNMAWHKLKISSSRRYKDYPQMVPFVYVCVCLGGFASLAFLFKGQKRSKMVKNGQNMSKRAVRRLKVGFFVSLRLNRMDLGPRNPWSIPDQRHARIDTVLRLPDRAWFIYA